MTRNGRQASVVANPVLVGAVTTLVAVVAVFLAYHANNGLPFVPTTEVRVQLANGANLIKGNEVRAGGFRVGIVQDLEPARLPGGRVGALVRLKLDEVVEGVPVDSTVRIRPRSALGLKYVELNTGRSREVLPDGGTLPVAQTSASTELDEVFSTFDEPTRRASQDNLVGFGDAFAGRGSDLSTTIQQAPELFGVLRPVMANLSDPATDLDGFVQELADTARVLAPVSKIQARLFTDMADTFDAISRDPQALRDTIEKGPATLDVATRSLRVQRPFLRNTEAFSGDLSAAAVDLRGALPTVNEAIEVATPVTRRSIELSGDLRDAFGALRTLTAAPATNTALRALTATITTLQPQLRYLGPHITVCNNWNFFWTLAAEHLSAPDPTGSSQRALANSGAQQDDSYTSAGANEFATGRGVAEPGAVQQFLHANFYGPAVDSAGRADCGAGQQGYPFSGNTFDDTPDGFYKRAVVDGFPLDRDGKPLSRPFDNLGPTFDKLDRNGKGIGLNRETVPEGQTFTHEPGGRGARVEKP